MSHRTRLDPLPGRLYPINLATGAATLIGVIDADSEVQGLAIAP